MEESSEAELREAELEGAELEGVELVTSECEVLGGADFITVELDTQPIEYVVKWAEVGSKFTISCVKRSDSEEEVGAEPVREGAELEDEEELEEEEAAFFAPYEEVYPCELTEQSVEIKTDSDEEDEDGGEEHQVLLEADAHVGGDSDLGQYEAEERQYRCSYCGKSYSHASSLYRHQQTHSAKGATPPSKKTLQLAPHDARYTCPHCGMSFKGSRMLGSHLRLHGKRRIHPCTICGKEFNHSSSLSRHRLVHKKAKGPGKDATLSANMAALRHSLKPGTKNKKAKRQRAPLPVQHHHQHQHGVAAAIIHGASGAKFYACAQCELSFRTSTQLSKHQVCHVKELLTAYTPGKENMADTSSDLKIRLKLCSGDKPNFYTLCNKNRRRRRNNTKRGTNDKERHSGEAAADGGRHSCVQCGKRFSHASSLLRHQQTHRADGVSVSMDLQHHAKQHAAAKSKTFTCVTCNKSFMHSSSFSRHKKAHLDHGQNQNQNLDLDQQQQLACIATSAHKGALLDESAPLESDSE